VDPAGLGPGIWYYRVSAEMAATDPDNPGGETLPSDPQPLQIPTTLPDNAQITLTWSAVTGAVGYRIYRTPSPGLNASDLELLAEVTGGSTVQYTDTGGTTDPAETPLEIGDLGTWKPLPDLAVAREGLGLGLGADPGDPTRAYLYALAGRDAAGQALDTYEWIPVDLTVGDVPTGSTWVEDTANPLAAARWQLGAFVVDEVVTDRVTAGDTWIYAGGGVGSSGTTNVTNVDAALVLAGGGLDTWLAVDPFTPAYAGYGYAAAANQLFVFGGQGHLPSANNSSAQICGGTVPCVGGPPDPPDLLNWNALGFNLQVERYLLGSTVGSAHIYLVGGLTTGNQPTNTIESSVW
jgi:hypothetical protein